MSSKPCRELMAKVQQQTDSNYPELLRYAMVVNAPKIFATLLAMFKPFIAKSTLDKIDIYGPDPEIWKAVVKQKFTVENIPPHWGGSLQGVDEFCSGGEIWIHGPKDMRSVMHGNYKIEYYYFLKVPGIGLLKAIAKFLVALSKSATAQTYELTLQGNSCF